MSQTTDTTPLSAATAAGATSAGALPAEGPVLLGTMLAPGGNRALLRGHDGAILTVGVGDPVPPYHVLAIAAGEIRLVLYNQVHVLAIPGGS